MKNLKTTFNLFSNKDDQDSLGDTKLVTFRVPYHLCNDFDELVKFKRGTRTSYLVGMMDTFIRNEVDRLKESNRINEFISDIKNRNQTVQPLSKSKKQWRNNREDYNETYYEPPMVPTLDDGLGWSRD